MRHTIVWKPSAEDDLAALWMVAEDRAAVSAAANMLDSLLKYDPASVSQSRAGSSRILLVGPLALTSRSAKRTAWWPSCRCAAPDAASRSESRGHFPTIEGPE